MFNSPPPAKTKPTLLLTYITDTICSAQRALPHKPTKDGRQAKCMSNFKAALNFYI